MGGKIFWEGLKLGVYGSTGFVAGRWFTEHVQISKSSNGKLIKYQMEVEIPATSPPSEREKFFATNPLANPLANLARKLPPMRIFDESDEAATEEVAFEGAFKRALMTSTSKANGAEMASKDVGDERFQHPKSDSGEEEEGNGGGRGRVGELMRKSKEERNKRANSPSKGGSGNSENRSIKPKNRYFNTKKMAEIANAGSEDEAASIGDAAARAAAAEAAVWVDVEELPRKLQAEQMIIHEETEMPSPEKLKAAKRQMAASKIAVQTE